MDFKHIKLLAYFFLILCMLNLITSCKNESDKASLIITNANIWTGNNSQITAQAMAIKDDIIIAIGSDQEIQKFKSQATEQVDMNGLFITPGFIDCHVHLMSGGNSLLKVKLSDAKTPEEFINRIEDFAKSIEAGTWLLEGNWDHTLWGGELPQKEWIDAYTQDNPVAVFRLDGHMLLANSKALEIARIDKNTPDVPGGEIVRTKNGEPTGVLKDNAMNILMDKIPAFTPAEKEIVFKAAMSYFSANGVTSVHDVDGQSKKLESISVAEKLNNEGSLNVRIYALKPLTEWKDLAEQETKNDKWIKRTGLKGFVDGSLGSHTAAFHEPYTDKLDDRGFFINKEEDLYTWISEADKANLQLMIHAIGDSAIHTLLNIYEQITKENGVRDRRLRIEHAQHISSADIQRFTDLGVIASMQPYHAIDDGRWAEQLIGAERIKTTYAFKSLMDAKAVVVFGSDWAVAPAAPLLGIYAAVTRRTLDDKNPEGWVPQEKISVEQALLAYTRDAAYASFEENIKGSLELGKLADFVVLSEDLLKADANKIRDIKVLKTYVGGKKVYDRAQLK